MGEEVKSQVPNPKAQGNFNRQIPRDRAVGIFHRHVALSRRSVTVANLLAQNGDAHRAPLHTEGFHRLSDLLTSDVPDRRPTNSNRMIEGVKLAPSEMITNRSGHKFLCALDRFFEGKA